MSSREFRLLHRKCANPNRGFIIGVMTPSSYLGHLVSVKTQLLYYDGELQLTGFTSALLWLFVPNLSLPFVLDFSHRLPEPVNTLSSPQKMELGGYVQL